MSELWEIDRFPLCEAAFDPKKPVDEDWYEKGPGPLLRSGDEATFLDYDDEEPKIDLGGEGQHPGEEHSGVDEYIRIPPGVFEDEEFEHEAAAKKKPKPKKPRTPEEVRYDVLKHPEGLPGGTGKSPEYHLRNRGWQPHTINEGVGRKTIQYMHPDYPGYAIQFGGATGTKPDHDFRVLDLENKHTPLAQRYMGPAEAMNRVEELHRLQPGHMVVPMLHNSSDFSEQLARMREETPKLREKHPDAVIDSIDDHDLVRWTHPDFPRPEYSGGGHGMFEIKPDVGWYPYNDYDFDDEGFIHPYLDRIDEDTAYHAKGDDPRIASWDIDKFPLGRVGAAGYPNPGKLDWAPSQKTWGGENDIKYPYGHPDAAVEQPKPPPVNSADVDQYDIDDWGQAYTHPEEMSKNKPKTLEPTPAVTQTWPEKKGSMDDRIDRRLSQGMDMTENPDHPSHGTTGGYAAESLAHARGVGAGPCNLCRAARRISMNDPELWSMIKRNPAFGRVTPTLLDLPIGDTPDNYNHLATRILRAVNLDRRRKQL